MRATHDYKNTAMLCAIRSLSFPVCCHLLLTDIIFSVTGNVALYTGAILSFALFLPLHAIEPCAFFFAQFFLALSLTQTSKFDTRKHTICLVAKGTIQCSVDDAMCALSTFLANAKSAPFITWLEFFEIEKKTNYYYIMAMKGHHFELRSNSSIFCLPLSGRPIVTGVSKEPSSEQPGSSR